MKQVARSARRGLGWIIFASGSFVALGLPAHGPAP